MTGIEKRIPVLLRNGLSFFVFMIEFFIPPYPQKEHYHIKKWTKKIVMHKIPMFIKVNGYKVHSHNSEYIYNMDNKQPEWNEPGFMFPCSRVKKNEHPKLIKLFKS